MITRNKLDQWSSNRRSRRVTAAGGTGHQEEPDAQTLREAGLAWKNREAEEEQHERRGNFFYSHQDVDDDDPPPNEETGKDQEQEIGKEAADEEEEPFPVQDDATGDEENYGGENAQGLQESGESEEQLEAKEREMFREQEMRVGNVLNYEVVRTRVMSYARWTVFAICPFPGEIGYEYSPWNEGMTDEKKYEQRGLVCRVVVSQFANMLAGVDVEKWWERVSNSVKRAVGRRRNYICEQSHETYYRE